MVSKVPALQDLCQSLSFNVVARPDTYHIDTSNVLFILSGAFVGLESVINRRVAKGVRIFRHFPTPAFVYPVWVVYRFHRKSITIWAGGR
jgi:hypothetical protein